MKIFTEIGWAHKAGGARRVAIKTLQAMSELAPNNEYHVLTNTEFPALAQPPFNRHVSAKPSWMPGVVWDQLIFPNFSGCRVAARVKPDLVHFTNNYLGWGCKVPSVVTIHDMTPFVIPSSFHGAHAAYQRAYFRIAAKHADHILTVSEHSKRDICGLLNVPDKKVTVMPLAAEITIDRTEQGGGSLFEGRPYVLYVGAIHPRKNVGKLVEAFSQVCTGGNSDLMLVIVGQKRWMIKDIYESAAYKSVEKNIHFTGRVDDQELANLYAGCSVFAYPSLYEGFGLPVLEAMSYGAPVITSNVSSLPEVAGDAAVLIEPTKAGQLAEAIRGFVEDPEKSREYRQRSLLRAKQFSWQKTAQIALDVYRKVLQE